MTTACPLPRDGAATIPVIVDSADKICFNEGWCGYPGLTKVGANDCELLCVYRAGGTATDHGDLVAKRSTDLGATWPSATTVLHDSTYDIGGCELFLSPTGRIILTYHRVSAGLSLSGQIIYSDDKGATWSSPYTIPHSWTDSSSVAGKPCRTASGRLILSITGRNTGDSYDSNAVVFSDDDGATWGDWTLVVDGQAASRTFNESTVTRIPGTSTLRLWVRSDTVTEAYYRFDSTDNGATWNSGTAERTSVFGGRPSPVYSTASGKLWAAYRHIIGQAAWVCQSGDDGDTWTDEPGPFSGSPQTYASGCELAPGVIFYAIGLSISGSRSDLYCGRWYDGDVVAGGWSVGSIPIA